MSGTIAVRSVEISVAGRVQGVGYRAFVERQAVALGLSGFVRNRRDGSVEAAFSGPADDVEAMIALCRQGPRGARVDRLDIVERAEPFDGPFLIAPSV